MLLLPAIQELVCRTKALAALDLILSPEWEYRYYSFNSAWSQCEQMASMRNGCGDEWWLVFHSDGWAALKGLAHESEVWSKAGDKISTALQEVMPPELSDFAIEPAFRWDSTGFAYFYLPPKQNWCRANDLTVFSKLAAGEEYLLRHLCGKPSDYVLFAEEYYEKTVSVEDVSQIFMNKPITDRLVSTLNPAITLKEISQELYIEIEYPQ